MFSATEIETKLKEIKPVLAEKFHVTSIDYLGSYAKGQQTDTSDLDLMVEFSRPVGWTFFTLEGFLEQSLGIKVDLTTKNSLKARIKNTILNQVKYIWRSAKEIIQVLALNKKGSMTNSVGKLNKKRRSLGIYCSNGF